MVQGLDHVRGELMRALLLCLTALCACSPAGAGEHATALPGSVDSLAGLADSAWTALMRGDTAAMERLRLSEYEHNRLVWPELPAARAGSGYPVDLAWQNIQIRNVAARSRLLGRYARGGPVLHGVQCEGQQHFRTFSVLTDCYLQLADGSGRSAGRFQLFKDVLVRNGEYKIFRYYFDGE